MTVASPEYSLEDIDYTAENQPPETAPIPREPARPEAGIGWQRIYKKWMAALFSTLFFGLALILSLYGTYHLVVDLLTSEREVISTAVRSINTLVIALAMFELGAGISKEYSGNGDEENVFIDIRRTITRFVGTVCIALVLEALIMIIKYSQLELAGNLYYPVAILVGAGILLISLGGFLALTRGQTE
ncbi:hypothetical protein [Saccharospirillum salsuginis]|uniref:Uncharacterized protein n=1 Tax=Saccharospirillum salsuginis TaxID=418750 RepID=A0A918K0L7_9GAMM|nr:hypothetical protein [Saccharospirillum salsuginis]GGX40450.1 hypothetical protein GCM10007392_03970 [Saccharospirillum salsuginis]